MSTAITMFLVKVGREKRIPFEVNVDPSYSPENIAELERRIASVKIKNGIETLRKGLYKLTIPSKENPS